LGDRAATPENFEKAVREMYPDHADRAAELYAADTWLEVIEVGTDLASDRFISQSTWKWSELHRRTDQPVYRYYYDQPRPPMKDGKGNDVRGLAGSNPNANQITPPHRAVHAAEIEYVLGNLETNDIYAWTEADYRVSDYAKSYFANFVKNADPNGADLPRWPAGGQENPPSVMHITPEPEARPARHRERHLFLDRIRGE
jgi:para-nitrobenzyl esterase